MQYIVYSNLNTIFSAIVIYVVKHGKNLYAFKVTSTAYTGADPKRIHF